MDSISKSAASLGLKRIEGRVKGLFEGSVSACNTDLRACNCDTIEELMLANGARLFFKGDSKNKFEGEGEGERAA